MGYSTPPTIVETSEDLYTIDCTVTVASKISSRYFGYDNYSTKIGDLKLNRQPSPNNVFFKYIEEVNALYSDASLTNLRFKPMMLIEEIPDVIVTRKDTNRSVKLNAQSYGAYLTNNEVNFFTEADVGKNIRVVISAEHIFNKKE